MRKFLIIIVCAALILPIHGQEKKYLALTFDDGPSGRFTRRLLDGLAELDAPATFFLCGYRMETYPELTRRIAQEGHEIGLHGYSHSSMGSMSPDCLETELDATAEMVLTLTGEASCLLRPPGGSFGSVVRQAAQARGLSIVTWSVDPRDWATDNAGCITAHVVSHAKDGDVILLHDMSDSSVDAALEIVTKLREKGFTFVTVSQLAQLREVEMIPGKCYAALPPKT